jgi:hypothetical protein
MSTLETQYREFLRNNPGGFCSFEEWKKINARLIKQALVNMMKKDEELGLYDQPTQRLEKYSERFDNDKSPIGNSDTWGKRLVEDKNPYIGSFLLKNGFSKDVLDNNKYFNLECIITVLDECYQIDFDHPEYGSVSTYTDSYSIIHLVGVLTWNDLIDKNYNK